MTIEAKIIEYSISESGQEICTYQLKYPRIIHPEFMTHRVFSRNASSSRAVPSWRAIAAVMRDPAEPFAWGSNVPGMQAGEDLEGWRLKVVKAAWHGARYAACAAAWIAMKARAHKQVVNRIIEPWSHISVVMTTTEIANWDALRDHPDADPTIEALAKAMNRARRGKTPRLLGPGEWHLPYVKEHERKLFDTLTLIKMSAARCARVSYLTHDGKTPSLKADLALYDRLANHSPMHASPLEHQATPDCMIEVRKTFISKSALPEVSWIGREWENANEHGNFVGWRQHRKTLVGENAGA